MSAVAASAAAAAEPGQAPANGAQPPLQPITAAHFAAAMKRVGPSMARGAAMELEPVRCGCRGLGVP